MASSEKNNSFPSFERIKSRKLFDMLFITGKTVKQYPVRMVWMETPFTDQPPLKMAVSVPKRFMSRAVDRNKMKRRVREVYRLHKQTLTGMLQQQKKSVALLFIVQSKTPLTYKETEEKINLLLQRLIQNYAAASE